MKDIFINQVIIPVLAAAIVTIIEIGRRQVKSYLDSKQELIDKQKEALKQSMGIEQYNKDKDIVKDAVKAAEQLGKEFDWTGEIKHSKVLELIKDKTGLSDDEVYYIIKGTVAEINKDKTDQKSAQ